MMISSGIESFNFSGNAVDQNAIRIPNFPNLRYIVNFERADHIMLVTLNETTHVLDFYKYENYEARLVQTISNIGKLANNYFARDDSLFILTQFDSNLREVWLEFDYEDESLDIELSSGGFFDSGLMGGLYPQGEYMWMIGTRNNRLRVVRSNFTSGVWEYSNLINVANIFGLDIQVWQTATGYEFNIIFIYKQGTYDQHLAYHCERFPNILLGNFYLIAEYTIFPHVESFGFFVHGSGKEEIGEIYMGNGGGIMRCLCVRRQFTYTPINYPNYYEIIPLIGNFTYNRIWNGAIISYNIPLSDVVVDIRPLGADYTSPKVLNPIVWAQVLTNINLIGFSNNGIIMQRPTAILDNFLYNVGNESSGFFLYRGWGYSRTVLNEPFDSGDPYQSTYIIHDNNLIYAGTGQVVESNVSGTPKYLLRTRSYTELKGERVGSIDTTSFGSQRSDIFLAYASYQLEYLLAMNHEVGGSISENLLSPPSLVNPFKFVATMKKFVLDFLLLYMEITQYWNFGINFNGWTIWGVDMDDPEARPDSTISLDTFDSMRGDGIKTMQVFPTLAEGDVFSNQVASIANSDHSMTEIVKTHIASHTRSPGTDIPQRLANGFIRMLGWREFISISYATSELHYLAPDTKLDTNLGNYYVKGWRYKEGYQPIIFVSPEGAEPLFKNAPLKFGDIIKEQDDLSEYLLNNP